MKQLRPSESFESPQRGWLPGSTDLLDLQEQPSLSGIEEPEAQTSILNAVLHLQNQMSGLMGILDNLQLAVNEIKPDVTHYNERVEVLETTITSIQVQTADMASVQSQILERLEKLEVTSAMWEQDQDYEWTGEPGSAEWDLEGALGGIIEDGQQTVGGNVSSVAMFGIGSDGNP